MTKVNAELAWSAQGDPVAIPATAEGWRVRKCPPRGGTLERVNTADGSGPLVVSIECTYAGFCEAVSHYGSGKYRLDAVDEHGNIVSEAPAYVSVGGANASASVGTDEALARTLETVERLAKTNSEAMQRIEGLAKANGEVMERITKELATQLSTMVNASAKLIEAADGAGITTREPAAVAAEAQHDDDRPTPAAPVDPNKPSPWEPIVAAIMPSLPQLLELGIKFAAMKFGPNAAAPAAGAAKPPPAAGANGTTNGTTNGTHQKPPQ